MTRTRRSEIYVAAVVRMLGRQYVVVQGSLIEVGIAGFGRHAKQALGKLEHIVGVARLRTFAVIDIALGIACRGKVLAAAVAAYRKRTVVYHCIPEKLGSLGIIGVIGNLGHTLETDHFWHLSIGMLVVKIVDSGKHAVVKPVMGEAACRVKILLVAGHGVSVGIHLVHAAKLVAEHGLHALVGEIGYNINTPVAHAEKQVSAHL